MLDLYSFWIGVGAACILFIICVVNWLIRRARKSEQVDHKLLQKGITVVAGENLKRGDLVVIRDDGRAYGYHYEYTDPRDTPPRKYPIAVITRHN